MTTGNFESRDMLELWVCDLLQWPGRVISYARIGDICGVSVSTVTRIAISYGLQRGNR